MDAIVAFVMGMVQQYPVLGTALVVIGALRLVLKPMFSFAHAVADQTPSDSDNKILDEVEQSGFMKAVYFGLDWLASVKLIKA